MKPNPNTMNTPPKPNTIRISTSACGHFRIIGAGALGDGNPSGRIIVDAESNTVQIMSAADTQYSTTSIKMCQSCRRKREEERGTPWERFWRGLMEGGGGVEWG